MQRVLTLLRGSQVTRPSCGSSDVLHWADCVFSFGPDGSRSLGGSPNPKPTEPSEGHPSHPPTPAKRPALPYSWNLN